MTSIPGAVVHGPLIRTTKDATLTYCAVAIVVPILEFWFLLHSVEILVLRFYVESILENLRVLKMPFLVFLGL